MCLAAAALTTRQWSCWSRTQPAHGGPPRPLRHPPPQAHQGSCSGSQRHWASLQVHSSRRVHRVQQARLAPAPLAQQSRTSWGWGRRQGGRPPAHQQQHLPLGRSRALLRLRRKPHPHPRPALHRRTGSRCCLLALTWGGHPPVPTTPTDQDQAPTTPTTRMAGSHGARGRPGPTTGARGGRRRRSRGGRTALPRPG